MATTRKTKKKVKIKNGIHIFRDTKKELRWSVTKNGRVLIDSGESYKRRIDLQSAMKSAHTILADFFVLNNNTILHDSSDVK